MNRREDSGRRDQAQRGIPWYRKSDCDGPVGSPAWQARIHLDQWSARQGCRGGDMDVNLALRRLVVNYF